MSEPAETPSAAVVAMPWFALVTAAALMLFFGWLTQEMFTARLNQTELQWARSMAIYSTVEAFALAAAGTLMGVQIQSGRVRAAEQRANVKSEEAEKARVRAETAESELGGHRATLQALRERVARSSDGQERGGAPLDPATELDIIRALIGEGR